MEVILQQDYPQLGFVGERVQVKRGFARNFLIPRGVAIESSSKNAKALNHQLKLIEATRIKLRDEAQELSNRLGDVNLDFKLKVGDRGKSFGSITNRDIEAALKDKGFEVERKQISLGEPIKTTGTFAVTIKLHSEVTKEVAVHVIAEKPVKKAAEKPVKAKSESQSEFEGEEGFDSEESQAVDPSADEVTGEEVVS